MKTKITKEFLNVLNANNLKIWREEDKKRWCMQGNGGQISRCIRASKGENIIIDGFSYQIDEITKQIYLMGEIKIAFEDII